MTRIDPAKARALLARHDANRANADERFQQYATDPVAFAREVLGLTPWRLQTELLDAVATASRVACRSGHRVGKTIVAAIIALWWVATRPGARCVLTAPTARQVREVLWREVRQLYRAAKPQLSGTLNETPDGGLRFPDGREVFGLATDQPERFAGLAGPNLIFVVDEASGVSETIFEALRGNVAGGGKIVLLGNPTRTSGTFFDAFNRKARLWQALHIPSTASPNITGEATVPGLATADWIGEMVEEYGEGSPIFQVRVLGDFPTQAADCVIGLGLLETARARWADLMGGGNSGFAQLGRLEIGVDPARFGDDESVIVCRRGPVALQPVAFRALDTTALVEQVLRVAREQAARDERPVVRVDSVGVGGGVADQLRQHRDLEVQDVNAGARPISDKYQRTRDELWFCLRDWLKNGGALPPDPKLERELADPRYTFTPSGKLAVESKDEMRARLKRSPDRADALALAVYSTEGATTRWLRNLTQAMRPENRGALSALTKFHLHLKGLR